MLEQMQPTVSLLKVDTYEVEVLQQRLTALLEPMGGMAHFIKPGDRVLLKPNLLTRSRPTKGCTTRPEIVYCVAKMVQAAGGEPFLGESGIWQCKRRCRGEWADGMGA